MFALLWKLNKILIIDFNLVELNINFIEYKLTY